MTARAARCLSAANDLENGPQQPHSYLGKLSSLLYTRYLSGQKPIAMVSMDNCSHNGTRLHDAVAAFAHAWCENGQAEAGFLQYVNDPGKVSFPWTMIDKITPRPDEAVEEILKKDGIEEPAPVITSKNTYVAPFVNAEECEYLVIEDAFPAWTPCPGKGRFDLHRPGDRGQGGKNEGMHLLKPAPYGAGCFRLSAGLRTDFRGNER